MQKRGREDSPPPDGVITGDPLKYRRVAPKPPTEGLAAPPSPHSHNQTLLPPLTGQPRSEAPCSPPLLPSHVSGIPSSPPQGRYGQLPPLPPPSSGGLAPPPPPHLQAGLGSESGGGQSQPGFRQQSVKFENALEFLDQVKIQFQHNPSVYNQFLEIMKEFKAQLIDTPGVIGRVSTLFEGHPQLILGFNNFLPPGFKITYDEATGGKTLITQIDCPPSPPMESHDGIVHRGGGGGNGRNEPPPPPPLPVGLLSPPEADQFGGSGGATAATAGGGGGGFQDSPGKQQNELTHARNYVKKIKIRFTPQPHIYKAFLEILHTYHKEQHTIRDVYNQVAKLFSTHPDLLEEFTQFLPDPTQAADMNQSINAARLEASQYQSPKHQSSSSSSSSSSSTSSSRNSTSRGRVKGSRSSRRSKSSSSSHSSPVPIDASSSLNLGQVQSMSGSSQGHSGMGMSGGHSNKQGQSPERMKKRARHDKSSSSSSQTSSSSSLPIYDEHEFFFSRMKQRLKNSPAYGEFLKVLQMFNEDIISRQQMMVLVRDLFQDAPDLFERFRQYIAYEEPQEPVEVESPAAAAAASTWAEIDFTQCKRLGSSYRALPRANQNVKCSGRTALAGSVLNDIWVSFPTGTEDGFRSTRKNQHEENLFRIEDDRYELDLIIQLNASAIRVLDPINKRINGLRRDEGKSFKIGENELDVLHLRAIERIYGEKGQDIIEGLFSNPVVAVPIILSRLQAKDQQWRQARNEWNKVWREIDEKNYYKSLDHQCLFFKQSEKKTLSPKNLVSEIKQIVQDAPAVVSHRQPPHMSVSIPSFATIHDVAAMLNMAATILLPTRADRQRLQVFLKQFLLPFFFTKPNSNSNSNSSNNNIDDDKDGNNTTTTTTTTTKKNRASQSSSTSNSVDGVDDEVSSHDVDHSSNEDASSVKGEEGEGEIPASVDDSPSSSSTSSSSTSSSSTSSSSTSSSSVATETTKEVEDDCLNQEEQQQEQATTNEASERSTRVGDDTTINDENGGEEGEGEREGEEEEEGRGGEGEEVEEEEEEEVSNTNKRLFFGSSAFYVFFRLLAFLIQRLHTVRTLVERGPSTAGLTNRTPSQIERMLFPQRAEKIDEEIADRYGAFTNKVMALLRGELEQSKFEDSCRELFGMSSYVLFTIDKLITQIIQQIRTILTDETSSQLLTLHSIEDARTNGFMESIYHSNAFQLLGNEQRCFRIESIKQGSFGRLTFLLFHSAQEPKFVPLSSTKQFWVDYIETYLTDPPQDDASSASPSSSSSLDVREHKMFLLRNQKRTSKNVQRLGSAIHQSGLECKVCLSTYRLFYVEQTEDFFYIPGSLTRARLDRSHSRKAAKLSSWQHDQLQAISC